MPASTQPLAHLPPVPPTMGTSPPKEPRMRLKPHLRGADSGAELLEKGAVPGAVVFAAQRQLLHRFALVGAEFTGLGESGKSRESTGKARESGLFPRENRPFLISSRGGTRTRTRVTPLRILSPVRLPFRHSAFVVRTSASEADLLQS